MNEHRNLTFLVALLYAVFFIIFVRLFDLQVLHGKENRFFADENRIQKIIIPAPRGLILDRHGEVLAQNEPVYEFFNSPKEKKILSRDEALLLQTEGINTNFKINLKRRYPSGETFSHVVGFLGEVSEKELKDDKLELKGYSLGSLIGQAGIESEYENLLRGRDGSELVEVDTLGKAIRSIGRVLPGFGKTLTLAIDKKLQEVAAKAMAGKKGAVVATNPLNGEVLILYSSPSFDNNLFLKTDTPGEIIRIIQDEENRPLFNRVISGLYQPGSTFKIVTAIAGLEEKKISAETLINDPGVITIGDYKYTNWYFTSYGRTEGNINLVKAISRSTDTFFYKVGEMVGIEKLNFWAGKFNLDKTFGIDLPGELPGFIATPEWKQKNKGESWFLGNTYHVSIGQGDLILTPLAVNLMTAVVANGGKICIPRILRLEAENTPYQIECQETGIKKENLDLVEKGMIGACLLGGTGWPFFDFKPAVACKTGTAETGEGKTTHAWFTVFAPACAGQLADSAGKPVCQPEIVLTVLVEKGGEGSSVAGPIAKEILKEYFQGR